MTRTRDQDALVDWVEARWDLDQIACLEVLTRSAVRLQLRDGSDKVLIRRRDGSVRQYDTRDLWPPDIF